MEPHTKRRLDHNLSQLSRYSIIQVLCGIACLSCAIVNFVLNPASSPYYQHILQCVSAGLLTAAAGIIFGGFYKKKCIPRIAKRPILFQILNTALNLPIWVAVIITAWNYPYLSNPSSRYANAVYIGIAFCGVIFFGLITGTLRLNMDALKASLQETKPANENGAKEKSLRSSYYDSSV